MHVECITEEDDAQHSAESSSRRTEASEEWNEKTLDTKMLTETRQVEETLEKKERVVIEQDMEVSFPLQQTISIKYLHQFLSMI